MPPPTAAAATPAGDTRSPRGIRRGGRRVGLPHLAPSLGALRVAIRGVILPVALGPVPQAPPARPSILFGALVCNAPPMTRPFSPKPGRIGSLYPPSPSRPLAQPSPYLGSRMLPSRMPVLAALGRGGRAILRRRGGNLDLEARAETPTFEGLRLALTGVYLPSSPVLPSPSRRRRTWRCRADAAGYGARLRVGGAETRQP